MTQKSCRLFLSVVLSCLVITHAAMARGKAGATDHVKTSIYADPARCKHRFNGTPDQVTNLLQCLYEPYRSDDALLHAASSIDATMIIASDRLRALLDRDKRCVATRHEICALEQDVLVWAQDVSAFALRSIRSNPSSGIATVTVVNGGEISVISFHFIIEHQRLALDDIYHAPDLNSDSKVSLATILKAFNYGR